MPESPFPTATHHTRHSSQPASAPLPVTAATAPSSVTDLSSAGAQHRLRHPDGLPKQHSLFHRTSDRPPLPSLLHAPTNSSSVPSLSRISGTRASASSHGAPPQLRLPLGAGLAAQPLSSSAQPLATPDSQRKPSSRLVGDLQVSRKSDSASAIEGGGPRAANASPARCVRDRIDKSTAQVSATNDMANETSTDSRVEQSPKGAVTSSKAVQRNPSLDSAMSSVSSATSATPSILSQVTNHSYHSSSETTVTTSSPPDAASIVNQAGSNPKVVIETLFKENKALNSRNEQLWRLVEKQRSMVHGLHADLERALKDKERYRRRLKDYHQEPVPSIPHNAAVAGEMREAVQKNRMATGIDTGSPSESKEGEHPSMSPIQNPGGPSQQTAPSQDSQLSTSAEDNQNSQQSGIRPPTSSAHISSSVWTGSPPPVRALNDEIRDHPPPNHAGFEVVHEKQGSGHGEKSRKAAPAPLKLSQSTHGRPDNDGPRERASESEYGDSDQDNAAGFDGSSTERGRRRTREQDDQEREMVAMAEEARSRSEKSKKSKSKQQLDDADSDRAGSTSAQPLPSSTKVLSRSGTGLPTSPRAPLAQNAPLTGPQHPHNTIAAILAPKESLTDGATTSSMTVSLPPKSPGLPMSPKPSDRPANAPLPRAPATGLASPGPLSPRHGLPLSPRAPKYAIPMPDETSTSVYSASVSHAHADTSITTSMAERLQSRTDVPAETTTLHVGSPAQEIYHGFKSETYPHLLLSPEALALINVKVWSSRLHPATHNVLAKSADDDAVFTLGVHLRADDKQLWRLEKKPSSLSALEWSLRRFVKLKISHPDRSIFSGHAPAKLDARRAAVNRYFEGMMATPMDSKPALLICEYLTKNALPPAEHVDTSFAIDEPTSPTSPRAKTRKEGYLAKKGKQFGGWKSRYFILENSQLKHFESPSGAPLGIIKLKQAQIARPNAKDDLDEDDEFRHAFTILEPKKKDSSSHVRHVLCAESDDERDGWVEALIQHIGGPQMFGDSPPSSPRAMQVASLAKSSTSVDSTSRKHRGADANDALQTRDLQTIHYEDTIALDAPRLGTPTSNMATTPSPLPEEQSSSESIATSQHPTISGPVAGGPIQNASQWGNKSPSPTRAKEREIKKRSVFGFMRSTLEEPPLSSNGGNKRGVSPRPLGYSERPPRAVFRAPLAEAAEYSQPAGVNICIPSPVYRCIEYLEAHEAANEEGIFRLSGSNTVIRNLRDKFDQERDVVLTEGPYVDVHAVASLLKLYLRELPDTILTRERLVDFQKVLEVEDKHRRLAAINLLIHQLPEANREVLVALSRYLIKVVNNSEQNRMTLKNVGIVFAPTLNIPTPLVFLFVTEFNSVFTAAPSDPDVASPVLENIASSRAEIPQRGLTTAPEAGILNTLAAGNGGTSPMVQQYRQDALLHSPKISQNSFSEHLAEQRQQLHLSSGRPQPQTISSPALLPIRNPGYDLHSSNLFSHSPSTPSGSYKMVDSASPMTVAADTSGDAEQAFGGTGAAESSSSSPNSISSSMRGKDGSSSGAPAMMQGKPADTGFFPSMVPAASLRKARRESAFVGLSTLEAYGPDSARRKSSYTRLKDKVDAENALREA
ncbi:MAG: hypothetical protein Q9159_007529 [Coniocarpon cinnabarinum]